MRTTVNIWEAYLNPRLHSMNEVQLFFEYINNNIISQNNLMYVINH